MLGFSRKELAEKIGFSQRTISHWEKGESDIPTMVLINSKAKLGLNIDWLLIGLGKKNLL